MTPDLKSAESELVNAIDIGDYDEMMPVIRKYPMFPSLVNLTFTHGGPPLGAAVMQGRADDIDELLERGALIDKKGRWGQGPGGNTPLHIAVNSGRVDMVQKLLEKGAKVDEKNDTGLTPLQLAQSIMEPGNAEGTEIVKILEAAEKVAKPNASTALVQKLTDLRSQLKKLGTTLSAMTTIEVLDPKLPIKVEYLSWGVIKVTYKDGTDFTYTTNVPAGARAGDCILLPSGSSSWKWKGTKHKWQPGSVNPPYDPNGGIAEADVKDLIKDADIFVLSTGVNGDLGEKAETTKFLQDRSKAVHVLPTKQAIEKYKDLVQKYIKEPKASNRVAALIHSTC